MPLGVVFEILKGYLAAVINGGMNSVNDTMIVAPLTTAPKKAMPTHVILDYEFLETASIVLLEQIRTIDQLRLSNYLGQISAEDMKKIDRALGISLGL